MSSKIAVKIKKGDFVIHQDEVWMVSKTQFYNPGKGQALMKVKIKHIVSGKVIDLTYKSSENVELADVSGSHMQFLYKDEENLSFMDNKTYEQYQLPIENVEELAQYLKEGEEYYVQVYGGNAVSINTPGNIALKITETQEDAVKGNTSTNARKDAVLETGATVSVPLFMKVGDVILINPETGEYAGRVNE